MGNDHQFALQLELARREAGLSKDDLARAVFLSPRTVRRYLSGERRPDRATVVLWEQACGLRPGALTDLYDAPLPAAANPARSHGARPDLAGAHVPAVAEAAAEGEGPARRPWAFLRSSPRTAAVLLALLLGLVAVLLPRPGAGVKATVAQPAGPRSIADHRFKPTYVGSVWIRVVATPQHAGEDHHITLEWGAKRRPVVVMRLGNTPRSLVFRKGPDDTPLHVLIEPPAKIAFGEGKAPDAAPLDINAGWT
jgi:transcriptional regulator with XRE-family HTH domain